MSAQKMKQENLSLKRDVSYTNTNNYHRKKFRNLDKKTKIEKVSWEADTSRSEYLRDHWESNARGYDVIGVAWQNSALPVRVQVPLPAIYIYLLILGHVIYLWTIACARVMSRDVLQQATRKNAMTIWPSKQNTRWHRHYVCYDLIWIGDIVSVDAIWSES